MFVIDGCLYSQFTAQGLMITARNYLDVYPYDRWNAKVTIKRVGELWNISVYILNHFFLTLLVSSADYPGISRRRQFPAKFY